MFWRKQREPEPPQTRPVREWVCEASDSTTERAHKIAEIALADIFDNETKMSFLPRAAFRVAQALERYELADATAKKAASGSILSAMADGAGYFYAYHGSDPRQINVRFEGPDWAAYVGSVPIGRYPSKDQAEAGAIQYIEANPEKGEESE